MLEVARFGSESLRETLSSGADDLVLEEDLDTYAQNPLEFSGDPDLLDQVFNYIDQTEEVSDYLHSQVLEHTATIKDVKRFFTLFAPNIMKGDYIDDILYDVCCLRDLKLDEICSVALISNTLGLSHIDIFVDSIDVFELDRESEDIIFQEYLSSLTEFLWFVLGHALATHRPEDRASIVFVFRDEEIFSCLVNRPNLFVPERFGEINLTLRCGKEKDIRVPKAP